MSFYDLSTLSSEELIAQFILETKGRRAFLSHSDYKTIDEWLTTSQDDPDLILLLLSEEFDKLKDKKPSRALPRSLAPLKDRITKKILQAKTRV